MKPLALMTLILLPVLAWGQRDESDWKFENRETIRRSFDVSSASGAKKLLVDNMNGFIHVNGYGGKEVQVTVEKHIRAESNEAMAEAQRDVKLDMSQQFVYRSSSRMTAGRTGKGGPQLSFDTFNGSIRLHSKAL